jgi:hypothetical protein
MKFKKVQLILFGSVALLSILLFGLHFQKRVGINNFEIFDRTNIKGVISYVGVKNHGSSFKLVGDTSIFVFYPNSYNDLDLGHSFSNFAKQGDMVVKGPYEDTMYLIKGANTYRYTFMKIKE